MRRLDVAVIGAGISGLAVATLLARAGHRVVVHERFTESRPVGSGLMLQPTGLAALDRLGVRAGIAALGARIDRLHGTTDRGAKVFDLSYGDLEAGLHALGVHRAALHGALWRAFAATGAALETGRAITGVALLAAGRVAPVDRAGREGAACDLLVDASGARSELRCLVERRAPRAFSYGAVWTTLPDTGLAPGMLLQRYVGARVMLGWLPLGRAEAGGPPLAALFWSLKPAGHADWIAGFPAWREAAAALWSPVGPLLSGMAGPEGFTLASYVQATARRPWAGPVVAIGDSAHATSPQLGQGANSGLLDALALADALEKAPALEAALSAYTRARQRHVRFYQLASLMMTPFFQSDGAALPWLRDRTFDRMTAVPWLRREMLRTLAGVKTGWLRHRPPAQLAGKPG
jgi:2-polyprenyl-6-methoxyphenol hydroxylase-like FAD-dependent oxidoreductase